MQIITHKQFEDFMDSQIGQPCKVHGSIIRKSRFDGDNFCPNKDELGQWCRGNEYPRPNGTKEPLIIRD